MLHLHPWVFVDPAAVLLAPVPDPPFLVHHPRPTLSSVGAAALSVAVMNVLAAVGVQVVFVLVDLAVVGLQVVALMSVAVVALVPVAVVAVVAVVPVPVDA
jgi:hypothetical protein